MASWPSIFLVFNVYFPCCAQIVSMGRDNFSADFQFLFPLLKASVFIGSVSVVAILHVKNFTVGDLCFRSVNAPGLPISLHLDKLNSPLYLVLYTSGRVPLLHFLQRTIDLLYIRSQVQTDVLLNLFPFVETICNGFHLTL